MGHYDDFYPEHYPWTKTEYENINKTRVKAVLVEEDEETKNLIEKIADRVVEKLKDIKE